MLPFSLPKWSKVLVTAATHSSSLLMSKQSASTSVAPRPLNFSATDSSFDLGKRTSIVYSPPRLMHVSLFDVYICLKSCIASPKSGLADYRNYVR